MSSMRVEPHPRGHIASCNGRVELIQARVEACKEPGGQARQVALREEVIRQKKTKKLVSFQRQVKERVLQRERSKQQQLVAESSQAVQCEQRVAEQAVVQDKSSTKTKFQRPVDAPDIEDIQVTASYVCPTVRFDGQQSAIRLARKNLLLRKGSPNSLPQEVHSSSEKPQYFDGHQHTEPNSPMTEIKCTEPRKVDKLRTHSTALRQFASQGQLEHAQKKQVGTQYLLFRRLYSDLEREQTRRRQQQLAHRLQVQQLKKTKEMERRVAEDQVNAMDSFSSMSTEAVEDQQRAAEWAELLALEQRKLRLQKARETDRYIAALRERLRERMSHRQATVPPLCSCGTSVWDTNPDTCANNCIFYRNFRAYAQALSTLLLSLET